MNGCLVNRHCEEVRRSNLSVKRADVFHTDYFATLDDGVNFFVVYVNRLLHYVR